ncbi:DNA polymerase III subunit delta [Gemelliphila palaticanis]|uniref:DNA polymerase III subunit delta n=1 Tax=Gemelliphila palaticanis TaxID=81950 RepID=A0ABX2SY23_9BACL|nr:DNA polymerase III subunit delta [Gemella palaticanis]MBF0715265.1 DNA polymerase III subunit delta [Gemella palaticanis]NYS47195.1 DNA polymerase III subunit delta [Gemella palaticanis]
MKNIYLLNGENEIAISEFQYEIAKKYLKNELTDFNYIKINMLENKISDLIYECQSSGFFSEKKVVIADNSIFFMAKPKKTKIEYNIDELIEYIKNPNEEVLLIFKCLDNIDSRKKIVKEIKQHGEVKTINNFNAEDLQKYTVEYLNKLDIKISKDVARFLIDYSGLELSGLKKELEKLELLCKNEITIDDIKNTVVKSLEYDIFSLTNELFSRNYEALRGVYNNLKLNGEEPVFLLSLISSQIRTYLKVKILLLENYSQKEIASKLNIHPYRVQLAAQKVYNYDIKLLMNILVLCKNYDRDLKTINIDKYTMFDIFINKLIALID